MTQQQTPVMEQPAAGVGSTPPAAPSGKKKKKKGTGKLVVGLIVLAAVIIGVAALLYFVVFKEDDTKGEAMTDFVTRGSIQSMVEGYGLTRAKDSATISPSAGTILELFVHEGDWVTEGQQLYRMDDTAAQEALTAAQKVVDNAAKELQAIYDSAKDLTITAPHAGKLVEVAEFKAGDTVEAGTEIATLVNDTKLRLSLYYNYTYENDISVGQSVQVSIPAVMGTQSGTVEQINKVRFISPEGGIYFEVVVVLDNPGTLTEGMDASAAMTGSAGMAIYPYENGQLKYYETTRITAKVRGPAEQVHLLRYADVSAGQLLVQLGAEDNEQEIAAKESALKAAEEKLKEATDELSKFNATAPISGTVLSCNLMEGGEVQSGQGITIADTSVMTIEIQVDERNIQYVKAGMMVDIDYQGNYYMGTVESVALTGTAENGMSTFPAVVRVENPDGTMMSNSYANYSFVASQSADCLMVPVSAVKYVSFNTVPGMDGMMDGDDAMIPEGGEAEAEPTAQSYGGGAYARPLGAVAIPASGGMVSIGSSRPGGSQRGSSAVSEDGTGYIVFVRADAPPENAIQEPDPAWECPKGFWAVPVEVGLSDTTHVEIVSGLNEGDEIFIGYATDSASSWG